MDHALKGILQSIPDNDTSLTVLSIDALHDIFSHKLTKDTLFALLGAHDPVDTHDMRDRLSRENFMNYMKCSVVTYTCAPFQLEEPQREICLSN